jgi:hypothetical protein
MRDARFGVTFIFLNSFRVDANPVIRMAFSDKTFRTILRLASRIKISGIISIRSLSEFVENILDWTKILHVKYSMRCAFEDGLCSTLAALRSRAAPRWAKDGGKRSLYAEPELI